MGHFCESKEMRAWRMVAAAAVILAVAAFLIAALPDGSDGAGSGKCGDDLTWELDDAGNLTISGSGEMYDYKNHNGTYGPWGGLGIKSVRFEGSATSIGNHAFLSANP